MIPVPQARPRRLDLVYVRPRPSESIAVVVAEVDFRYRYAAVGELRSCSGVTAAPNAEIAVLDAIDAICAGHCDDARIRFVVNLRCGSPLWPYAQNIADGTTGYWIERASRADRLLIEAAAARLQQDCMAPPVDLGSVVVATDGSVRSENAGFGWVASSGDYGVSGYRSSSKRVGTDPVLVAELCAIGDAVSGLPRRHLTVLTDSRSAIAMVNRWKKGDGVMPAGYPAEQPGRKHCLHSTRRSIHLNRDRINVQWVRGHCGQPLNEGADALAGLGSRYRRGDRDLDNDEYRRRAAGIAQAFAAEFCRVSSVSA
jgi:ribonuclease HI